jgi:hypothetical protein
LESAEPTSGSARAESPDEFGRSLDIVENVLRNVCVSSQFFPPITLRDLSQHGVRKGLLELKISRSQRLRVARSIDVEITVDPIASSDTEIIVHARHRLDDERDFGEWKEVSRTIAIEDELSEPFWAYLHDVLLRA